MWHEARRQEKKIRGLMVDLKRRADRRREFYEKIKQDPTQFLRMYGRPVKIHLDPAVAMAAEGPQSMMAWQGDNANMIDRFDVRANLDIISEYNPSRTSSTANVNEHEERSANYERYRTLVENEAAGLSEEHSLHQIYLDEHFGTINKPNEEEKKKNADKKAAIGYVYEDSTPVEKKEVDEESEEESDDDLDMADLDVTIDVDSLTPDVCKEVNVIAGQYGMAEDDFIRLLRKDKEELEALKEARQLEEAKAQFSGRKSRRERRAINEKRQNPQRFCRPSYAARDSPKYEPYKRPGSSSRSRSRSRSKSPERTEVKFITSFGGNDSDDEGGGIVQGPSLQTAGPTGPPNKKKISEPSKCETPWLTSSPPRNDSNSSRRRPSSRSSTSRSRSRSRSRSSPRDRGRRSRGRSDSRRRSSSSSSRSRSLSRSRSRSRSSRRDSKRSRSRSADKVPVKRYRRESLSSSSGMSGLESDEDKSSHSSSLKYRAGEDNRTSSTSGGKLSSKSHSQSIKETPQERLKRRMQAQLNKQYKADKKAEICRISKQEQERMDREEEIKTLAIEMRRRERERRHKEREEEENERRDKRRQRHDSSSSDSSSRDSSRSRSRSRSSSLSSSTRKKRRGSDEDEEDLGKSRKRSEELWNRNKRRDEDNRRPDRRSDGGRRQEADEWGNGRGRRGDAEMEDIDGRPWYDGDSNGRRRGAGAYGRDNRYNRGQSDGSGGGRGEGSRWGPRGEPSSSSSQHRRRPLLHRPDSPPPPLMSRGRYYPRD